MPEVWVRVSRVQTATLDRYVKVQVTGDETDAQLRALAVDADSEQGDIEDLCHQCSGGTTCPVEDGGDGQWNLEMDPLGHEILSVEIVEDGGASGPFGRDFRPLRRLEQDSA